MGHQALFTSRSWQPRLIKAAQKFLDVFECPFVLGVKVEIVVVAFIDQAEGGELDRIGLADPDGRLGSIAAPDRSRSHFLASGHGGGSPLRRSHIASAKCRLVGGVCSWVASRT